MGALIRSCHEHWDGSGYPDGLKGDNIPLHARIILVADTFDAMTTHRPYQAAMDPAYVVRMINSLAKNKFDPRVVAALTAVFERGAFGWSASANYATNRNRIVSLGDGAPIQLQWLQWMREGYPVGSFFGDHIIERDGQVGWASALLPRDAEGNLPQGWDYLGQPLPTRQVQLGSNFTIGPRVALSLLFEHKGGHMNHDHSMRWLMQAAREVRDSARSASWSLEICVGDCRTIPTNARVLDIADCVEGGSWCS